MKSIGLIIIAAGLLVLTSQAQAALESRLGGAAAYDTVLDITWLTNANALGSGTWQEQVDAAATLDTLGFDDWRLASMSVSAGVPTGAAGSVVNCSTATEMACRDNELGYMFYQNMGGSFPENLTGNQTVDGVDLTDIQFFYWSGTELDVSPDFAWFFFFNSGNGSFVSKTGSQSGWAVRSGDVGAVPIPAAVWLFGSALGIAGIGFTKRKAA